jgi:hypothetical protein
MNFNSSGLIKQIKRRALVPTSQSLFTDNELIDIINEELQNRIIPYVMNVREDYFLSYIDVNTSGQLLTEYTIPSDSIGGKIHQINIITNNDNDINSILPRITVGQIINGLSGYYIEGNKIKFYPALRQDKIRIYYFKRPAEVVNLLDTATIDIVNPTNIECISIPTSIDTGTEIDIISSIQPWDKVATKTVLLKTSQILDLDNTNDIFVGYFVAKKGQSPFAQISQDIIPLLTQACVVRVMEAMNDQAGFQNAMMTYSQMESDNRNLISPRVTNQPKKISTINRLSRFIPR